MKPSKFILTSLAIICLLLLTLIPARPTRAVGLLVGLVVDENGIGDNSFNYMANQGLERADTNLGVDGTLYEPADSSEYEAKLQDCVDDGNQLCIGVGFMMGTAIENVANANPTVHFAIVDVESASPISNLRNMLFDEKQAGYLAGALAGKMTTSDVIGVVGGWPVPAVVDFAEGYRNGAHCANGDTNVIIIYTNSFGDPALGAATAAEMMGHGADVIFGAAGATGNGAILYSAQHDVWSIGVDVDEYLTTFNNGATDGSDMLLTSAMKKVDNAVYDTIDDEVNTAFTGGAVNYELNNDGVGLAPYHETDTVIPQATKDYITQLATDIGNGTVDVNTRCAYQIMGDAGSSAVDLNYTDGTAKTVKSAADGWYSLAVSPNWSGTVTPAKAAYTFVPISRSYTNVTDDAISQNYQARTSKIIRSTGTQDGYVLESTQTSNVGGTLNSTLTTLRVGDDNLKKQYRSILSFATGAILPDNAVITKVTLKIKLQSTTGGGNPVTLLQGFLLDIKKGTFGTAALQTTDFQTAGNKTLGAFKTAPVGGWYTFNMTTAKAYINKLAASSGLTQIRVRFKLDDNNNTTANYLSLYSGNAGAATRPQLIVEYYIP